MPHNAAHQQSAACLRFHILKKAFAVSRVLALGALLLSQGCGKITDADSIPKRELAKALTPFLKVPPPPADPDEPSSENPGWYDPANRQGLRDFIAKFPDSEECYYVTAWLIFARSVTEVNRGPDLRKIDRTDRAKVRETLLSFQTERKHKHDELADELSRITSKTGRPGTAKMAKLLRVGELLQAENYTSLEEQVRDILDHVHEYETERDEQFLRFARITEIHLSETEPTLRHMLVIRECHQHHLDKALALAQDLKKKFPSWSRREGVDGNINMLERGQSPFPTWEDMRDSGRTFSNRWSRTPPAN